MKTSTFCAVLWLTTCTAFPEQTSITSNHITWTFDQPHEVGQFLNGEYWVVGPVKIVSITNDLHDPAWKPEPGQDGSMINPEGGSGKQGYHSGLDNYDAALNAARPNGQELSAENPLDIQPGQSLVSVVSWLYKDKDNREPGAPKWYGPIPAPRPTIRSAAVLTALDAAPPAESFRPPYCGTDKTVKYQWKDVKMDKLAKLEPVDNTPDVEATVDGMARVWLDHMPGWGGAVFHPSMNMPNYGRDMGQVMVNTSLLMHLDFDQLPGQPDKKPLVVNLIQYGIDLAGIADTDGRWPADGGHGLGRKWPILFAGAMLEDEHLQGVGKWETRFQEDETTFYISQEEVDITNGPGWKPDRRSPVEPYTAEQIGTAEWGIRHRAEPNRDNAHWKAKYRDINNRIIPGFVLAAHIMGLKTAWNHDPLFDYADRIMTNEDEKGVAGAEVPGFQRSMWQTYRKQF